MMSFSGLVLLASIALQDVVDAEFFSDVDSREGDETKALEIKAKEFWQSLMQSAQGLEAAQNAKLSARIEGKLKRLPAEYDSTRDQFHQALSHLAKADSMLFEEASRSKMLALQRLDQGASGEALCDYVSQWEDALYTAYTRFTGHRMYEKKLARHILSRLTEADTSLSRAAGMAPQMYDESEKASDAAHAVVVSPDLGNKKRDEILRDLAGDLISATGKQRRRFEDYLYGSLLSAAQDLAGEHEQPSQTVMRASLRGAKPAHVPSKPTIQVQPVPSKPTIEATTKTQRGFTVAAEKTTRVVAHDQHSADASHLPLIFADGVPVDAEPVVINVL